MMEPDYRPVKRRFLPTVLAWAFPKALSITIAVIISQILGHVMGINADHLQTMMYISVVVISMLGGHSVLLANDTAERFCLHSA